MTDIQLMRDIIKNNFHFFPNQNHSSKYTDIETVFLKKRFLRVVYIKQYKLSAPQLSFYVIYKIRENVMKDDPNYNKTENIDFFVIY